MLMPQELESDRPYGPWSCRGCDVWDALCTAHAGSTETLGRLLKRDPNLCRAEYHYTQPIHLAVRQGHLDAVRLLLDAGADPGASSLNGESLITAALDRGHGKIAELLEEAQARLNRVSPDEAGQDHPIHLAAEADDAQRVAELLDADPQLVRRSDAAGGSPLHRAAAGLANQAAAVLLDRGADVHALHGVGPASERGYAAVDFQPIDVALWSTPFWNVRAGLETARLLVERGADCDLTIASALGDLERVQALLDEDPQRIAQARPCGKRALSAAVEFGHQPIVRLLLERGADPNWPEGASAPRGASLHAAARSGNRPLAELLLAHGADPNSAIDSSGSATYAAQTPELRRLLISHGGHLDPYDLVWLGEDDEAVRRVSADPRSAQAGCGTVLAAACTMGKKDLVVRLLKAGARLPQVLTGCRSYLLSDAGLLGRLLESGMDPNLPDWQHTTPLHDLCSRDSRGRPLKHRTECAKLLIEAGATLTAKDEEYRSTPLAWAARSGLPDMVELLLVRGASTNLADDEPWATPLAWASRRGHRDIVEMLRRAGEAE